MSHAFGRRTGPFGRIIAASGGLPVFTAGNVLLNGGKLQHWVDWNNPQRTLTQSTSAMQVAAPLQHANFKGLPCAAFTGNEWYVSNQTAAFWDAMHNGPLVTIVVATFHAATGASLYVILETSASTTVGISYRLQGNAFNQNVSRTGAVGQSLATLALSTSPVMLTHANDGTNRTLKMTGATEITGSLTGTPTTPAQATLMLGSRSGSFNMVGRLQGIYCCLPAKKSEMQAAVYEYTGVAP